MLSDSESLFFVRAEFFFSISVGGEREKERTKKQNPQRDSEIDRLRESFE